MGISGGLNLDRFRFRPKKRVPSNHLDTPPVDNKLPGYVELPGRLGDSPGYLVPPLGKAQLPGVLGEPPVFQAQTYGRVQSHTDA